MDCQPTFKRVKERSVWEAKESVDQWRKLFKEGITDSAGKTIKLTLKQAAEYVGIPKKTLEDYHQLLRKVNKITPLENLKDRKMGYLRQFLKDNRFKDTMENTPQDTQFDQNIYMEQEFLIDDDMDEGDIDNNNNLDYYEQQQQQQLQQQQQQQQQQSFNQEDQQIQQLQQHNAEPQDQNSILPECQNIMVQNDYDEWESMILEGPTAPSEIEWDDIILKQRNHNDRRDPFSFNNNDWDQIQSFRPIVNCIFINQSEQNDLENLRQLDRCKLIYDIDFDLVYDIYNAETDDEENDFNHEE